MNIHLILKEGDEDLIYLRNFLPPKSFGKFINFVITAERPGRKVFFGSNYDPFGKETGYLDLRLAIKGKENIEYVSALPSRKRTIVIKELIRKQIKICRMKKLNGWKPSKKSRELPKNMKEECRK